MLLNRGLLLEIDEYLFLAHHAVVNRFIRAMPVKSYWDVVLKSILLQ